MPERNYATELVVVKEKNSVKASTRDMPERSYADQIKELHRVFKLKRILKAWRESRSYLDRFEESFERVLSLTDTTTTVNSKQSIMKRSTLKAK